MYNTRSSIKARTTSWKQWVSILRSESGGDIEAALGRISAAANSSSTVAANGTAAIASGTLRFSRYGVFTSAVPNTVVFLPDNSNFSVTSLERGPFPSYLTWVRDAALALTPDNKLLYISGGMDNSKVRHLGRVRQCTTNRWGRVGDGSLGDGMGACRWVWVWV